MFPVLKMKTWGIKRSSELPQATREVRGNPDVALIPVGCHDQFLVLKGRVQTKSVCDKA